jgi:tetratricopeptide (TPR) repeat protein
MGDVRRSSGHHLDSIAFYKRAIELDPNFALAYARLGTVYGNTPALGLASEYRRKAFELKDRVSEPERMYIAAHYHLSEGEVEKAREIYEVWSQTYPRAYTPRNNLGVIYSQQAEHERALREFQEALRLNPTEELPYFNVGTSFLALGRIDEARRTFEDQQTRLGETPRLQLSLSKVAAVEGDWAAVERHGAALKGSPEEAPYAADRARDAARFGRRAEAWRLTRLAAELADRQGIGEAAAAWNALNAEWEAEIGGCTPARERVALALERSRGPIPMLVSAVTLARCGDRARAEELLADLDKIGRITPGPAALAAAAGRAAIHVAGGNPAEGARLLDAFESRESVPGPGLVAMYTRGRAHLLAGDHARAAAVFEKMLRHTGLSAMSTPEHLPLARLGLARAQAAAGDTTASRKSYQDFLAIWKDADPDIPLLHEARAEYAKLGSS